MNHDTKKASPAARATGGSDTPAGAESQSKWGMIIALVVLVALAGGAWRLVKVRQAAAGKGMPPNRAQMEVPVVAGVVKQQDVPVFLDGLGTVQAFNTVTVRPRVDGLLQKVTFTEGQEVKAGEVLAEIDPTPFLIMVQQAEAKKAEDDAKLANARQELTRDDGLIAQKILSQKDLDDQRALVNQLEAAVKADQSDIDTARVQLGYTKILSPIDGRTGIRQVDQGNLVHAADANGLVVVTQLRPISLIFTLPEQSLGQIRREQGAEDMSVVALERDNSTVAANGKLMVIDNQIDSTTGTIRLKAKFANENLRLWPGQFVNTRLLITTRKAALVVPFTVVQRGPEGTYAYVVDEDQTVSMRPIKVGLVQDGLAVIESGLKPGETVVVDGQYKLQKGSKVRIGAAKESGRGGGPEGGKPGADAPRGTNRNTNASPR